MQGKHLRNLLLAGLFLYLPFQSMAWGMIGHRVVGQIAENYLNAKARKNVREILGTETMAMASTWADYIKSDTNYKYLNNWHYLDFNEGLSQNTMSTYLQKDTAADIYTRINSLAEELRNKNLSHDKKLFDLRMLIHLVGDLHQPMHLAHSSDLGGNTVKVMWFGEASNLHRVWDEQLIEYQQLSYTEYADAINHTTTQQRKDLQSSTVGDWLLETHAISEQIYKDTKPEQKLSYAYNFKYINILNEQLLKGGVRLAGLLNSIFS
jgi:hypothetical protein